MEQLRILDTYVHQGHQKEFAKTGHKFFLMDVNGGVPKWNKDHRLLPKNVKLISERQAMKLDFDVVIVRACLNKLRYNKFVAKGAIPVAVVQTTTPFDIASGVRHIVWNSRDVMMKFSSRYRKAEHYYIVHGYDPEEFCDLKLERNNRVLTVANVFRGRGQIMGYPLWRQVRNKIGEIDLVGHGNKDVPGALGRAETFQELIQVYNTYSVFFNPTQESAMPRSRVEATMCGCPLVSTDNYDVKRYYKHGKDAFLSNDPAEIEKYLRLLLSSKAMQQEFGARAREVSIRHFHINEYVRKWNKLLGKL